MKPLPDYIQSRIGGNEELRYWCRRASFEMVEEFSEGLGFMIFGSAFIWGMSEVLNWPDLQWALVILGGYGLGYILYEYAKWWHEIHILTDYISKDAGVYYKATGIFSYDIKEMQIAKSEISGNKEDFLSRWWRRITGQSMQKVVIFSEADTKAVNSRMPAEFARTFRDIRGSPSNKNRDSDPTMVQQSREARAIIREGALPRELGEQLLLRTWRESGGSYD